MTKRKQKVRRNGKNAQKLHKCAKSAFILYRAKVLGLAPRGRIPKQMKYIGKRGIKPIDASDHDVMIDVTTSPVVTINITSSESVLPY